MPYFNRITILGHITQEPELKYINNGMPVCKFTVAVRRDGPADVRERESDFFNVSAWGKQAEFCGSNIHKGDPVLVDGKMKFNKWVSPDGSKKYFPEVSALRVILMRSRSDGYSKDTLPEIDDEVSFDV